MAPNLWAIVLGRLRLLVHPAYTGAIAILAIDDHILKPQLGGWWPGKLSDVAGVFVVAVALATITRRPRFMCVLTGLGLVAIKVSPLVASLAAPLLGGQTRQDLTDLVALVALWPAYRFTVDRAASEPEPSIFGPMLAGVAGGVMFLTLTATSCLVQPVVDGFVSDGGHVYTRVTHPEYDAQGQPVSAAKWATSDDGGHTWSATPPPPQTVLVTGDETCDGSDCFRIVNHDRVEERITGPWSPVFEFTAEQRRRLHAHAANDCGYLHVVDLRGLVLVRQSDGLHVIVGAAQQGVLHRRPDGAWERRAVLDRKPLPLNGPSWLGHLSLAPFGLLLLCPVLLLVGRGRAGWKFGFVALGSAAGVALALITFSGALLFFGVDYVISGPVIAYLSLVVFALSIAFTIRGRKNPACLAPTPPG